MLVNVDLKFLLTLLSAARAFVDLNSGANTECRERRFLSRPIQRDLPKIILSRRAPGLEQDIPKLHQ